MTSSDEITLDCDVEIDFECLFQYRIYSGLLEGSPTRAMNARLIQEVLSNAKEKLWSDDKPHLIVPSETVTVTKRLRQGKYVSTESVTIPPVACLATFKSSSPASDEMAHFSTLNVVWFQNDFGFPVDDDVLARLRALDWENLATDGYW